MHCLALIILTFFLIKFGIVLFEVDANCNNIKQHERENLSNSSDGKNLRGCVPVDLNSLISVSTEMHLLGRFERAGKFKKGKKSDKNKGPPTTCITLTTCRTKPSTCYVEPTRKPGICAPRTTIRTRKCKVTKPHTTMPQTTKPALRNLWLSQQDPLLKIIEYLYSKKNETSIMASTADAQEPVKAMLQLAVSLAYQHQTSLSAIPVTTITTIADSNDKDVADLLRKLIVYFQGNNSSTEQVTATTVTMNVITPTVSSQLTSTVSPTIATSISPFLTPMVPSIFTPIVPLTLTSTVPSISTPIVPSTTSIESLSMTTLTSRPFLLTADLARRLYETRSIRSKLHLATNYTRKKHEKFNLDVRLNSKADFKKLLGLLLSKVDYLDNLPDFFYRNKANDKAKMQTIVSAKQWSINLEKWLRSSIRPLRTTSNIAKMLSTASANRWSLDPAKKWTAPTTQLATNVVVNTIGNSIQATILDIKKSAKSYASKMSHLDTQKATYRSLNDESIKGYVPARITQTYSNNELEL
ncbi:hypothetical protein CHUAL_001955 [Chamberlinius hualienensis]